MTRSQSLAMEHPGSCSKPAHPLKGLGFRSFGPEYLPKSHSRQSTALAAIIVPAPTVIAPRPPGISTTSSSMTTWPKSAPRMRERPGRPRRPGGNAHPVADYGLVGQAESFANPDLRGTSVPRAAGAAVAAQYLRSLLGFSATVIDPPGLRVATSIDSKSRGSNRPVKRSGQGDTDPKRSHILDLLRSERPLLKNHGGHRAEDLQRLGDF
jgi:hypothetical protein